MPLAEIKITSTDEKNTTVFDKKIEIKIKKNTYFFTIDNFYQEILVKNNQIQIIRPEMIINLKKDQITKCIYKNKVKNLKMNFILNSLKQKNNDLCFNYSLIDNNQKIINNINVEIKF